MVVGIVVEFSLSGAILKPVLQLTDATTRVAGGDLDAAVPVRSNDEIGALASGFNRMAERIRELRRSDLGKLLVAQQTTEAAIDSLYDPVVVTDSAGRVTRINAAAIHRRPIRGIWGRAGRRANRVRRGSNQRVGARWSALRQHGCRRLP
jgi:nitrogen fixation/metabolism regulation signal transduction histidine kinase